MRLLRQNSLLAAFLLSLASIGLAETPEERTPRELEGVGVTEKLGQPIDLSLTFVGEDGYPAPLSKYFQHGKPVILNLVYYTCPMLCNLVLNGQTAMLRELDWTVGDKFEVITISIDPTENFNLARDKKALQLASYERPTTGWHFLADHQNNVKRLADSVGFHYRLDEKSGQYAHSAAIFVLTPEGKISRYLYGVKFKPFDVKMSLTEAAEGRYGATIERLLLYCFHYDPASRAYILFARNVMRGGGALTMLIFGFVLYRLFRRDRTRPVSPARMVTTQ